MKVAITQSNYIPWKGFFDSIAFVDMFILYDDMQYTRRDWRNRNRIKTPQGLKWLTIPVEVKGKYHQKINETRVSNSLWAEDHWKTILHHYRKAPGFDIFGEQLQNLYQSVDSPFLSEINEYFLQTICNWLGIKTNLLRSSNFNLVEGKTERLVSLCKQVGATDYYSGLAAKSYMEEDLFLKSGIKVHYWNYSGYAEYPQLHGDFEHGVSIIDLLLNTGKNWNKYLKFCNNEETSLELVATNCSHKFKDHDAISRRVD